MSRRVLIVDDNPMNLKLAKLLVSDAGYEPVTAIDGNDALRNVRSERPDLILMDLQMPDMDGLQLTRLLKADPATQGIPIVAVTASAMVCDEDAARAAGCDGFIRKPLDTRTFSAELAERLPLRRTAA